MPRSEIVANVQPVYQYRPLFPFTDGATGAVGDAMQGRHTGPVPWHSDQTAPESYLGPNTTGANNISDYQVQQGRFCNRVRSNAGAGGPPLVGTNFPAWYPAWSADVTPGAAPSVWNLVAIFDVFFTFELAASSYVPSSTGVFWLACQSSDNVGAGTLPLGAGQNRAAFGVNAVDDGSGGQGVRYAAWDTGIGPPVLEDVRPTTFSPQVWNHARAQIVAAAPSRPARLSFWINGEAMVEDRDFDGALLKSPLVLSGAAPRPQLCIGASVEAQSAASFFWRWSARFGAFDADGTEIRS